MGAVLGDEDEQRNEGSKTTGETVAEAFFLAGVGGEEPELEDLSRRVERHLTLIPVEYPAAGARGAVLSNMRVTAQVVASDILRRPASGAVSLVGYSFGGSLALEVANQLTSAGRTVGFLGILDAPFGMEELRGLFEVLRLSTAARRAAKKMVEASAASEVTLRLMSAAASPTVIGLNRAEPVRRALLTHLRTKALAGWEPEACRAPGVLICTGVLGDANRDRWMSLCPNLSYVQVDSEHETLLMGDSMDRVAAALVEAIQGTGTR